MTSLDKTTKNIKSVVLFFNAIFFVSGLALVGVGSWSLYEFGAYQALSISVPYSAASKLMITAGVFNVLVSFFGFWAAPKDNRRLFLIFFLILVVILGLEISAEATGYHYREKVRHTLHGDMLHGIHKLYRYKTAPSSAFDALQENERCCGSYNYTDWRDSFFTKGNVSVVPDSCCKKPRHHCSGRVNVTDINTKGCYKTFLFGIIRVKLYYVTAVAIPAVVLKALGILFVFLLILRMEPPPPVQDKLPLSPLSVPSISQRSLTI